MPGESNIELTINWRITLKTSKPKTRGKKKHKKVPKHSKQTEEAKQNSREKTQTKLAKEGRSGRPIWRLGGKWT